MKKIYQTIIHVAVLIIAHTTSAAWAQTYTLYSEKHCANRELELSFNCKSGVLSSSPKKIIISKESTGQWIGVERGQAFPMNLIKEDKYILILDYPVLYSGIANIVLMKKTGRFYFTEIAYSPVLESQGYDVESGRFEIKN